MHALQVNKMLLRLLQTLRDKQAEADKALSDDDWDEEAEDDEDDTADLEDDEDELDEDETELLRYVDEEASSSQGNTWCRRIAASRGTGEEDSDDDYWTEEEEAQTPIDHIDPFIFYADAVKACPQERKSAAGLSVEEALQLTELAVNAACKQMRHSSGLSGYPGNNN